MLPMPLLGGLLLGWALGANDSANVFGTAVASRVISFRRAALYLSVGIIAGAYLQGEAGMHTYRSLTDQNLTTLAVTVFSTALTVTAMTLYGLPVSTSQAIVGAIAGVGLANKAMNWAALQMVVLCWLATPVGALLAAILIYCSLGLFISRCPMSILTRDKILWSGLILFGVYGAYALGANNVANATGVFSGHFEAQGIGDSELALLGGAAMAFGAVTCSRRVMSTVGSAILPLNAYTGLVAVSAMAVTVHFFAVVGVPVSTSQAIVGAIVGIGLMRGGTSIRFQTIGRIVAGWLATPAIALILAAAGVAIFG